MRAIDRIRRCVREERYRISLHANEEISEDRLLAVDIEAAILTGEIRRRFTSDPRGVRYEIVGTATDSREVGIVCRFLPSETLLIIAAYEL